MKRWLEGMADQLLVRGTKAGLGDPRVQDASASRGDRPAAVWWDVRYLRRDGPLRCPRLIQHSIEQSVPVCRSSQRSGWLQLQALMGLGLISLQADWRACR